VRRLLVYRLPIVLYMGLVLALSINPMPERMPEYWQIDKLYHFCAYLMMSVLWARAIYNGTPGRPGMRVLVTAAVLTISFGALVEVYQSFIPYRSGDVLDAVANGAGGFAGVVVYARLKRWAAR